MMVNWFDRKWIWDSVVTNSLKQRTQKPGGIISGGFPDGMIQVARVPKKVPWTCWSMAPPLPLSNVRMASLGARQSPFFRPQHLENIFPTQDRSSGQWTVMTLGYFWVAGNSLTHGFVWTYDHTGTPKTWWLLIHFPINSDMSFR